MLRKTLVQFIPSRTRLREIRLHEHLGTWIYRPSLWRVNRHSVSMAFFVGLFISFVPVPGQTVLAAILALLFRCNLPLSLTLVWISNPLTMPVLFYFAYRVGALILQIPDSTFNFEPSWAWLFGDANLIWKPLLLGCFTCGITSGALGYFTMNMIWRAHVALRLKRRSRVNK